MALDTEVMHTARGATASGDELDDKKLREPSPREEDRRD